MFAEHCLVVGVDSYESASDAKTKSFGLTFVAATVEVSLNVVFTFDIEGCEGLFDDILKNRRGEIYFDGAFVDGYCAVTFLDDDAGNCCFTTANCVYCFHASIISVC